MPNLLTRLFRREPEITRYTVNDYINWLTNNGRYGLTQPYGMAVSYSRGKPAERIENSYEGYTYGGFKANPIVFGTMTARSSVFSEARFMWRRIEDGRPGDLFSDDALDVLRRPWPNGTTGELLSRMIQDVDLAGNCYLVNEGDRLRRLRPDWVQIVLTGDPRTDQDVDVFGYVYTPGGPDSGDGRSYMPDEVCHWSPIPDPDALYRGMSWLTPVVREIQGDSAAVDHKIAFFRNGATLGPIVKVPAGMTAAQFKEFVDAANNAHQGVDNAYRPMYVGGGADVTLQAATMQQLDFKALQGASETRICVAARVPAVIAGVSEGLAGSSLNAGNYGTAKRSFADGCLRPMWRSACAALMAILQVPDGAELWYDERDIAFLRDDEQDIAQIQQIQAATISSYYTGGWVPETARDAVVANDLTKLKHTGVPSVQVQEAAAADADYDGVPDAEAEASEDYEAALDEFRSEMEPHWDEIWRTDLDEDDEDEIERRDYYDVRDFRGRFRKMSDRIGHALNEWLKGDGEADDPLEEFSRENLRLAAKEFGITPRRGASSDELKLALLKDARARFRGERDASGERKPVRMTLQSPKYRDLDVGVYREANGKVGLYRLSPTSETRGSKVASFDDLAELEQWGRDNGEPRVAQWAASERGVAKPTKRAPANGAAGRRISNALQAGALSEGDLAAALSEGRISSRLAAETYRDRAKYARNAVDVKKGQAWGPRGELTDDHPDIAPLIANAERLEALADAAEARRPAAAPASPRKAPAKAAPRKAAKSVPAKASPRKAREPLGDPTAKIASLRALGDVEAVRDDLDLHTVAELKILAGEVGVATSGRKRDVVDRITAKVSAENARPTTVKDALAGVHTENSTVADAIAQAKIDDPENLRDWAERIRSQAMTFENLAGMRLGNNEPGSYQYQRGEKDREEWQNLIAAAEVLEGLAGGRRKSEPLITVHTPRYRGTAVPVRAIVDPGATSESSTWKASGFEGLDRPVPGAAAAVTGYLRRPGLANSRLRVSDAEFFDRESGQIIGADAVAKLAARADRQVKALDGIMAQSRTDGPMTVYRGADPRDIGLPADAVGFEWTDAGFASTSTSRRVADGSFAGQGRVLMTVRMPEGTPALQIDGLGESEILVGRGQRYRVIADHGLTPAGARHIEVEIVPTSTPLSDKDIDAPDPEQSARDRQSRLETARTAAEALVDLDTMAHNGGSEKALRQRVDTRVRMGALTEAEGERLREAFHEAEVENSIRTVYRDLAANPNSHVMLADIRDRLPGISDEDFNAAVRRLARAGDANLVPQEDQKRLTTRLRGASVRFGDRDNHMLAIEDPFPTKPRDRFRAVAADILSSRGATTHHTVGDVVPFDPSTMRAQGDRPDRGTPVQVVSPGASLTEPDGTVVTLAPTVVMDAGGPATDTRTLRSRIAELSAEAAPLTEFLAEYGEGRRQATYQQVRAAADRLKELTDEGNAAAQELLDALVRADDPFGGDPDLDAARWRPVTGGMIRVLGTEDPEAIRKLRDAYVVGDRNTIVQNASLRTGEPTPKAKSWATRMRRMVRSSELTDDATLYRGAALPPEVIASMRPGTVMRDRGILSMATDESMADTFAGIRLDSTPGTIRTIFEVRAPRGTPAVDVEIGEVVLDHGNQFRIVSSRRRPDGTVHVVMELIP